MACALRFDGYRCIGEGLSPFGAEYGVRRYVDRIKAREFSEDVLENFAAFFALQRYLGKWGGEYLTVYSEEHLVYRLLFLHLYRDDVPRGYEYDGLGCYTKWERTYKPIRQVLAAQIRRNLRRRGRGPKIDPGEE
jgi:hypothetical protein